MYCSHIGAELSCLSLPCLHVLFAGRQAGGRAFIEEWKISWWVRNSLFSSPTRRAPGFGLSDLRDGGFH